MTAADPNTGAPTAGWPQQPTAPVPPAAPQQTAPLPPQQTWQQPAPPRPAASGSILRRWPVWAQNTAIIVGAVAVLAIVFFAGFFTGHATDGGQRGGFGTNQNFDPRQFGGNGNGGFGGGSGSGSGTGSGTGGSLQQGNGS